MRPRLVAVAAVAVAVASTTGCGLIEKPSPFVTLYSDGHSVKSEASVYCFDEGATLPADASAELPKGCTRDKDVKPTPITVRPGDDVAIDVEKRLKESGWTINQSTQVVTDYYRSLPVPGPEEFGGPIQFDVVQLVDEKPDQRRGIWTFELRPADS